MSRNNILSIIFSKKAAILSAAAGIILIIISYSTGTGLSEKKTDFDSYSSYLESRLEEIISDAGCGNVSVLITMKDSVSNQPPEEAHQTFGFGGLQSEGTPQNAHLQEIAGVVIVCSSISEKSDFNIIKEAASTALDIPKNKIYIFGGAVNQ